MSLFGIYPLESLELDEDGIKIELRRNENVLSYIRQTENETAEKIISSDGNLVVNPVEPVNLPSCVTNYLLIELKKNVVIAPKAEAAIFVKFPVEVGVFVSGSGDIELVDVFSLARQKYTLYGDPRNGIVCRYWKSDVYQSIPDLEPLREGLMKLEIRNGFDEWVEVSRCVLDVYLMKIFYSDELVFSNVKMDIESKSTAETRFVMEPLNRNMRKAVEIFTPRKVRIASKRFFMEWGL